MDLRNSFKASGRDYDEFREVSEEMAQKTFSKVIHGRSITFLSLCTLPNKQEEGKIIFYVLDKPCIDDFLEGKPFHLARIPKDRIPDVFLDELRSTTGLAMQIEGKLFLVANTAIPTLTLRASVSGNETICRQNLIRDMHLADAIFDKNEPVHLVYRTEMIDGREIRKVFAGLGSAFTAIPQTILSESVDLIKDEGKIGPMTVYDWRIDHEISKIYVEFPESAEDFKAAYGLHDSIVPGVILETSDVGKSSVVARGVYRKGGGYIIADEVSMKHSGKITKEDVLKRVNKDIFTNIRKLPETLAKLIAEEVIDYSTVDLTKSTGSSQNFEEVKTIIVETIEATLKEIPFKWRNELATCMTDEIDGTSRYTLYDLAIDFMGVPDRLEGLDEETLLRVRRSLSKVPYYLEKRIDKKKKKDEKLVLLSA